MRIIFAGTPEVAVPTLRALVAAGHDVCAVLTRPDAPVGRKRILTPSPVAIAAIEMGIPLIRAAKVDDAVSGELTDLKAALGVVVAFGGLLPQPALDAPANGWINLHFSALPLWRGAAPVQRSVMAGDTHISTTVFRLVAELDAGDVYSSVKVAIGDDETAGALLTRLSVSGSAQVCHVVDAIDAGVAAETPQTGESTYARKLSLEDARLDVSQSVDVVYAHLRGVTPEPGAFVLLAGERFKLLQARTAGDAPTIASGRIQRQDKRIWLGTATQALELLQVQPAGKPRMAATDWFNGLHDQESVVTS